VTVTSIKLLLFQITVSLSATATGRMQSVKIGSRLPYIPILYPSPFTRQTVFPLQRHFRIFVSIIKSNPTITAKAGVITAYTLISGRITSAFANANSDGVNRIRKKKNYNYIKTTSQKEMNQMNKTLKKTLSIILTILMLVTSVPFAFAADTPVAKIGDVEYTDFDEALSNWVDGTTLTLLADVMNLTDYIQTTAKGLTLDLNGHTLASADTWTLRVWGASELTIRDSKGNGNINGRVDVGWTNDGGPGTLLLESGTLEEVGVSGIFTMTGGTIQNESGAALDVNNDTDTVLITGGEIYGSTYGIWISSGNVIISGDTKITGAGQYAIWSYFSTEAVISGTPTISGGAGEFDLRSKITLNTQPADGETWRVKIDTEEITDGIFAVPGEGITLDIGKFASAMDGYEVKQNAKGELLLCNHTEQTAASNGDGTHNTTCNCGEATFDTNVACSGGVATDTHQAYCEYCNAPYGEVNPDVHCDIFAVNMTAEQLQSDLLELLNAGNTDISIVLAAKADEEMFTAINTAFCSSTAAAGSVNLTIAGAQAVSNITVLTPDGPKIPLALKTLTLPGATALDMEAITYVSNLEAIYLPNVTSIDAWGLDGLDALNKLVLSAEGAITFRDFNTIGLPFANIDLTLHCNKKNDVTDGTIWQGKTWKSIGFTHNYTDGICSVCGEACDHKDSTHTTATDEGNGIHSFECSVCGKTVSEAHNYKSGTPAGACVCGAECPHSSFDSATGNCTDCETSLAIAKVETGETTTYYLTADELRTVIENNYADQAITLLADLAIKDTIIIENSDGTKNTLDLNGHTLICSDPIWGRILLEYGELEITGTGSINIFMSANDEGTKIVVGSGVTLNNSLRSAYGGVLELTNATIPEAGLNVILYSDYWDPTTYNVSDVLKLPADYYFFVDGKAVSSYSGETEGTVLKHADHSYTYTDNGDGTHDKACSDCGDVVVNNENHTLTYSANGNIITESCSANCGYTGTATIGAEGKTYDGNAVEVVVSKTGSLENTIIPVTLTKDGEAFTGEPVNAGTYTASISMGENENAVVASVEFIIENANPVIAAAPTPDTLTYIGEAQYLISAGEAVGGTMVYSLTENGEYTTTIPQGTNAGDYTVWYYVKGNANHNDSAKDSVPVTIKKAPLTVTASDITITYGEAPTNNGVTYSGFVNGENEGVLGGELAYTYTYTQNGNVGNYSITPEGLTADNYEITFVDGTLTVEQIDIGDIIDEMKINLEQYSYVYDGTEKKPKVTSITVDGVTLTEGTDYTVRYEDNVYVGNYATAVIIFEGNYDGIFRKWFTITKAYYNLTAPAPNTLTYNGEEQYLVSAGIVEGADFEYSLDGASWSTSIPQAKDVGNYTVYYRVLADENHYGIEGTVDVTIKECPHTWDEDGYCRKCKTFCKHENNVNGVCTVCDYVLTFSVITGDTVSYYDSFDDALENAEEGSTVKLMKGLNQIASYEINKSITLDLNGNSWDTGSSDYIDVYTFVTFTDSVGTGELNLSLNLYAPCLFNSGTYKGIGIMFETEDTLDDYLAECHGFFDHYTGEFKDVSDEKYVMGAKVDFYHKLGVQTCKGYQCEICGEYFGEADPDAHDWSNKDGICAICAYECAHEWDEGVLTRPVYDAVLGSKDGYCTYTCTVCGEKKTEAVKSADYSAYEAVSEEINALLQSDDLTSEAKQAIYSAANECELLSNDLTESEQNKVDSLVAELEKIVADAEEKIASGEYVKADYTEIDEAIKAIDEALENATISEEMANEFSDIKSQLEALKVNENTSMADVAELLERVKAVAETMADCANGIHSFTKYEEVTAPECGKAGLEKAVCDYGCGATDEKEIPALEHIDEDGDYLCDHGCGHEFEKPVEPEQPDTPDIPDEPTDEACDHLCHSNNAFVKFIWKIINFFFRLFNIQQYCDCGELHYKNSVFG